MYDHLHLCYLYHSTHERLKPLSKDFHDVNPTCKHAFLYLEYLSRFSYPYFASHDFAASSLFDVYFVAVFVMISWWQRAKCGISPLMFQQKIESWTWRQSIGPPDCPTNVRSKEGKSDPRLTKGHHQKENYHPVKESDKTFIQTDITYFWVINTLNKFCILYCHHVIVLFLTLRS